MRNSIATIAYIAAVIVCPPTVNAQDTSQRSTGQKQIHESGGAPRGGIVCEYKVIDRKTKKNIGSGKLRIKDNTVFAVSKGVSANEADGKRAGGNTTRDKAAEVTVETKIGEVVRGRKKVKSQVITVRFDKDSKHFLSGTAVVKRDAKTESVVWSGYYTDAKKKRWRFEMRRLDSD